MRVLLIYTNQEKWPVPVAPIGLTWVAGSLRAYGHEVRTLDCMFLFSWKRIERELSRQLEEFQPQLIGLSLRNIDNTLLNGTKFYLPEVKKLVEAIRRQSAAEIVAGGAGFSLLPGLALRFLGLRYGIVGEGDDYLWPTFYLSSYLDREAVQAMENACGRHPQWSTPNNPWGYFSVMRTRKRVI